MLYPLSYVGLLRPVDSTPPGVDPPACKFGTATVRFTDPDRNGRRSAGDTGTDRLTSADNG